MAKEASLTARRLEVSIVGDSSSFRRSLSQSSSAASKFGNTAKKVGKVLAVGLGAGLAVAAVGLKKSFDAAKEAELAQRRLEAQLRASGISYEKFGDRIDEVLTKQSALSAFDDEDLSDSFTNLVRVTEDVNEALRLNALAADFARAKGMDVAKAGELIGKVAGGNIGILGRYGIQLKDGATKQEALAVLQEKFAGQAEAYGSSVAGAGDRVKVAMENIAETVGEMVFPLAGRVLSAFSDALVQVQEFVNKVAEARGFKAKFNVVFTGVKEQAERVWGALSDFLTGTSQRTPLKLESGKILEWEDPAPGLIDRIREGIEAADWSDIGQKVGKAISERIRITADFIGNVLETANQFIDENLDKFAELGAKMLLAIIGKLTDPQFWAENWKLVLGVAVAVFPLGRVATLGAKVGRFLTRPIVRAFTELVNKLPTILGLAVLGMVKALGRFVGFITGQLSNTLGKIPGWIRAAFRLSFVIAFVNGVQNLFDRLRNAVTRVVDFIKEQFAKVPGFLQPVAVAFSGIIGIVLSIVEAVKTLIDWISRIPSPGDVLGGIGGAIRGALPFGANGFRNFSGGLAVVGEQGPELVTLPRGSNVYSNRESRSMARNLNGGGGYPGGPVLIMTDRATASWLQEMDKRYRRSNGGRGILG